MAIDGLRILIDRAFADLRAQLQNLLKRLEIASSTLDLISPAELLSKLVEPRAATSRATRDIPTQFAATLARLAALEASPDLPTVATSYPKLYAALLSELCDHRIAEAYPLGKITPTGDGQGHVVLMREVRHLPRSLARLLAAGLSAERFVHMCKHEPQLAAFMRIQDDMACPVAVLAPPYIEHLMQRWTLLFSRIGVDGFGRRMADDFRVQLETTSI